MIPDELEKKLEKIFRTIKFKKSKDGNFSVCEWDFSNDDDVEIESMNNFDQYSFIINALFERDKFNKLKNSFINLLSQSFVIVERRSAKAANKRVMLTLKLKQVVSLDCN